MILIRTDASTALGTGHAMRCLALAQALREAGSDVTLLAATLPEAIAQRYREEGVAVELLDAVSAAEADVAATTWLAARLHADWLVTDGYAFDDAYVDALARELPVLVIDDWPRAVASATLLLNQNAYATPADYPRLAPERLLLGPRYALLRREYATTPPAPRRPPGDTDRILVTLGGADPDDVTARVVAALADRRAAVGTDVRVVIGAAHPAAGALEAAVRAAGYEPLHDVRDMLALADWADIAIAAAGSTSLELASRGLPAIHLVLIDNQARGAAEMERLGVSVSVAGPDDGLEARLWHALEELRDGDRRTAMSEAGRRLVDGEGARRVAARLLGADDTSSGQPLGGAIA